MANLALPNIAQIPLEQIHHDLACFIPAGGRNAPSNCAMRDCEIGGDDRNRVFAEGHSISPDGLDNRRMTAGPVESIGRSGAALN